MREAAAAAESGLAKVGEVRLCYGLWGGVDFRIAMGACDYARPRFACQLMVVVEPICRL